MTHGAAFHENTLSFGPCEGAATQGPAADRGGSFFCLGFGTERIDPARLGDLETCFSEAILCGPCESHREAQQIMADLASVLERAA